MITSSQQELIKSLLKPTEVSFIGVFGSYARGDQQQDSDLDILVEFSKEISLLDLVGLEQNLTEKLGIKVDLVSRRSVNEHLMPYIEHDLIQLT